MQEESQKVTHGPRSYRYRLGLQVYEIRAICRHNRNSPGTRRDDFFHAHRHHGRAERLAVCAVPVADQIPRRRVPWKGFANLLCYPIRTRICGDAEMLDAPPLMAQHDEDEQNGEPGRRDDKDIDRIETAQVVVEERALSD